MKVKTSSQWLVFSLGAFCMYPTMVSAVTLNVFSFTVDPRGNPANPTLNIVSNPPFVTWDPAAIASQPSQWLPAQQFLGIRTDLPYKGGVNWGIQVFTDNTQAANAATSFDIPDIRSTDPPRTVNGPLTPPMRTLLAGQGAGTQTVLPKSGLVGNQDGTRLPLTFRLFPDVPFPNGQIPPITENPQGSSCDFDGNSCDWFYFLDKGDQAFLPGGPIQSNWQDGFWYSSPVTQDGALYSVCPPGVTACSGRAPLTYSGGFTTQILAIASNFRNGTRQLYSTTLFVELFVL